MSPKIIPLCPVCNKPMVIRTAKRGAYAGNQFWGCTGFPDCKGIRNFTDEELSDDINEGDASTDNLLQQQESLILEPIPDTERKSIYFPKSVKIRPSSSTKNVRLFQSVGSTHYIVNWLHIVRDYFEFNELRAFSQWRLDFPSKYVQQDSGISSVLAVVEKILTRGSVIPSTPELARLFLPIFQKKAKKAEEKNYWFDLFNNTIAYLRSTYKPKDFDSQAEEIFYHKLLHYPYIENWIMTQVPISSLTDDEVDPKSRQRVDFLLSYPGLTSVIIEIDGPQHIQQKLIDQNRDTKLMECGYEVLRIKASEVEKDVNDYPEIRKFLFGLNLEKSKISEENEVFEELFILRSATQVQIALLQALRNGALRITDKCNWKVQIIPPKWITQVKVWDDFVNVGISDLIGLLTKIYLLHQNKKVEINFSHLGDRIESANPDILISFNGNSSITIKNENCYTISDIYLPIDIAQTIPQCDPIIAKRPDKEISEYFLNYIFGKASFRDGQWEAIERTLQGKDSILLLPTGAGKTIAFQLAAFLLPGICLVIDPLISLIDDQIDNLKRYGIDRAIGISSQLDQKGRIEAIDSFSKGFYLFCYAAPERFQIKEFRSAILALIDMAPVCLVTIDEAHCVSEWGHDFKVSYLNIARNSRNYCNRNGFIPPIMAMTGTASRSVLRDMRRELEILELGAVVNLTDFDRPELNFKIIQCRSKDKEQILLDTLNDLPRYFGKEKKDFFSLTGKTAYAGLIFFPHVNGKYGIAQGYRLLHNLNEFGNLGIYSGKPPKSFNEWEWTRRKQYEAKRFKDDKTNILICTNAFGMGIDKENIRYTIHMNLPPSIEAAYQEAGRAGRDQQDAMCILIVSPENQLRINKLLNPVTPINEIISEINNVNFDADDITRQMYFHIQSFNSAREEIENVRELLAYIGDLHTKKNVSIKYIEENQTIIEKGVHRLLVTGVLDDYSVDYAHKIVEMHLSGNDSKKNLESYVKYVENYDRRMADQERKELSKDLSLSQNDFVLKATERLINHFIYGVVEQSRRRSLSEMLQACQDNPSSDSFKRRILSYFNLSHFSDFLEKSAGDPDYLSTQLDEIAEELNAPIEAEELRGQTARQLQAYPNNPSLLLLRSLAEAFCSDMRREIVFENFNAYTNFATTSWGMENSEVINLAIKQINQIGRTNTELAEELVVALLDAYPDKQEVREQVLTECNEEYTLYAIYKMIENINVQIEKI